MTQAPLLPQRKNSSEEQCLSLIFCAQHVTYAFTPFYFFCTVTYLLLIPPSPLSPSFNNSQTVGLFLEFKHSHRTQILLFPSQTANQ